MSVVNALHICDQLAAGCHEALNYYKDKLPNWSSYDRRKLVLNQGAANFDSKYNPDDENEKDHYLTDYYVSAEGYMKMHLKQNLAVLQGNLPQDILQPILFVDFGCGPMTSGLALAEILSGQTSENTMQAAYFGVDASANMVNKANSINEEYGLFPKYFKVVQDTKFDAQKIPNYFPEVQAVLLSLSYVLAPGTLQKSDDQPNTVAETLANDWKKFISRETQCQETIIVYMNPVDKKTTFHNSNWSCIFSPTMLSPSHTGDFIYTGTKMKTVRSQSFPKVALAMIQGTRQ